MTVVSIRMVHLVGLILLAKFSQTLCHAVYCWGCRNRSIAVLEIGGESPLAKYHMILSHGVIQFCEFGFSCCFQPE